MADVAYHIGLEPVGYTRQQELPRMEKVMKSFVVIRWVEIGFIITSLVLIFLFRLKINQAFWYGFGVALLLQAVIMLGADYFAETRAAVYTDALKKIITE